MRAGYLIGLVLLAGCGSDGKKFVPPPAAETGELVVRWTIVDVDGTALDCADLDIVQASVAIGGEPNVVPCGESQQTSFDGILPGRLPIVVRLLNSVGIEQAALMDNVQIVGGQTTEYDHEFVIDQDVFDTGGIDVRWLIDMTAPAAACSLVGAVNMRINTRDGSISEIDMTTPCADGRLIIPRARTGAYSFFLRLLDANGDTIGELKPVSSVAVVANDTAIISVNFDSDPPGDAVLEASWTLTGSVATSENCVNARGDIVIITLFNREQLGGMLTEVTTATAACSDGGISMAAPALDDYRVASDLIDTFGFRTANDVQDDIDLRSGTATIAIDFANNI